MSEHTFDIESFEHKGKFYDISVSFEFEVSNDGIGSYEYWGAKGFDAGHDYAEVSGVSIEAVEVSEEGETSPVTDKDLIKELEQAIDGLVTKEAESIDLSDYEPEPDDCRDYDCD
jgi:hypothetical protein